MDKKKYPQNLLDAIAELYGYQIALITDDRLAGLYYAISTLDQSQQRIVEMRFQKNMSIDEICTAMQLTQSEVEALCKKAIIMLRHPYVNKYILYGIAGYTLHKSINLFLNALLSLKKQCLKIALHFSTYINYARIFLTRIVRTVYMTAGVSIYIHL